MLTHGFLVDSNGRKMAKSGGNAVSPQHIINQYGADVLRLWVASTDYRNEIVMSDEVLAHLTEGYRRIRNTVRFLLGNLSDFNPAEHSVPREQMLPLDLWAVIRCAQIQRDLINAYEEYRFHQVYQMIHKYCSQDMGGFYLDILKDRLYTTPTESLERRSAQTALHLIAEALVCWVAPILPFTAEEIWQHLPEREGRLESVHLAGWSHELVLVDADEADDVLAFWQQVRRVRDDVNRELEKLRIEGEIGSSLDGQVSLYAERELLSCLQQLGDELRFALIVSAAQVQPLSEAPDGCAVGESGVHIVVRPGVAPRCERCWHRSEDISTDEGGEGICGRCLDNLYGDGERRLHA